MMRKLLWMAALLVLANCAPVVEEAVILAEPVVVEPAPDAGAKATPCGEDDGIGGTGCSVD